MEIAHETFPFASSASHTSRIDPRTGGREMLQTRKSRVMDTEQLRPGESFRSAITQHVPPGRGSLARGWRTVLGRGRRPRQNFTSLPQIPKCILFREPEFAVA